MRSSGKKTELPVSRQPAFDIIFIRCFCTEQKPYRTFTVCGKAFVFQDHYALIGINRSSRRLHVTPERENSPRLAVLLPQELSPDLTALLPKNTCAIVRESLTPRMRKGSPRSTILFPKNPSPGVTKFHKISQAPSDRCTAHNICPSFQGAAHEFPSLLSRPFQAP